MLRIWGRLSSINVRKVVWAAQELGIAFQRTDAGGQFGIVRDAHYLQLNPNGLVPLIEEVAHEAGTRLADLDGIACTEGPGLAGALLVGASVANARWKRCAAARRPNP